MNGDNGRSAGSFQRIAGNQPRDGFVVGRMRSLLFVVLTACGAQPATEADADPPCIPPANSTAPTYTQLYAQYFAPGTPGHCATAHCHADPGHDTWLCGASKDSCYAGMVSVQLIDPIHPTRSMIGDPNISPLSWVSPSGDMPFDATMAFPAGRDAIVAWVAACAQNN
jgi:hypothetical protein